MNQNKRNGTERNKDEHNRQWLQRRSQIKLVLSFGHYIYIRWTAPFGLATITFINADNDMKVVYPVIDRVLDGKIALYVKNAWRLQC